MNYLPNVGEIVSYTPNKELTIPAYVVNIVDNIYYLYAQNRLVAIQVQHTIEEDSMTGDMIDEYDIIDTDNLKERSKKKYGFAFHRRFIHMSYGKISAKQRS